MRILEHILSGLLLSSEAYPRTQKILYTVDSFNFLLSSDKPRPWQVINSLSLPPVFRKSQIRPLELEPSSDYFIGVKLAPDK